MPATGQTQYPAQNYPERESTANVGRMLPQNIDAEKSVLAACMLSKDAIGEVAVMLTPENFFRPAHQIIFASMLDLYNRHIPIDQLSVADNLRGTGQLEAVGGKPYLLDLADNTYALTNWHSHAEMVKRTSVLRDLVFASTQISALAYDAPDNLDAVVEDAEKFLFAATEKRISSDFRTMDDLLSVGLKEISELCNSKSDLMGVPSGFKCLDGLLHGFRGGDLIILAARTGMGKTAFALNIAVNAAKAGATVAFLSLEMSANQLVQRILSTEARVNLQDIRSGRIKEGDWGAIAEASETLSKVDLLIDDTPSLSILELRAKARRELRDKEQGLIIVDYLQLMQPMSTRREVNRTVEVGEISRGLKILAKEMNMPVIALAQLSRQVEQRGRSKQRPQLSDLRESGSIEQDADIVMFIDRSRNAAEAEEKDRPPMGTAKLIVEKHRNGPTGEFTLAFNEEYTRFMDYYDDSRISGS